MRITPPAPIRRLHVIRPGPEPEVGDSRVMVSWLMVSLLMVSLLMVSLGAATGARAQPQDDTQRTAVARTLFEEGLTLGREGRWAEAADRYRRVLDLRDSAQVRFNLAQALAQTGRFVESRELLRQILREAADAPQTVRDAATTLLPEVEPQVAGLTIRLAGDRGDIAVALDGDPLDLAMVGVAVPADPGHHVVRVTRGGEEVASGEVDLVAGGRGEVALEIPARPAVPDAAAAARGGANGATADGAHLGDQSAEGSGSSVFASPWLWIGVGVAVIAGGVIATLLLSSGSPGQTPLSGNLMPGRIEFP